MSMESALNVLAKMPTPEQKAALQSQPGATVNVPGNEAKTETTAAPKTGGGVDEAIATEASTPSKQEEPKKDVSDLSSKFGALAKREKAIVKQQQDLKSREAAFATREAAIAVREAKIQEAESLWDKDVFKSLEARGLDYNKLTKMFMDGQNTPPKQTLDPAEAVSKALAEFEAKQAAKDAAKDSEQKAAAEKAAAEQTAREQEAYSKFKSDIEDFVKTNETDYELINLYDQSELVVDTIQEHFNNTNKVLSMKEASEMVEKYLEEEAQKALKSKKLSAPKETAAPKKESTSKTLSNQLNPSGSAQAASGVNDSDRMKRALAKLR